MCKKFEKHLCYFYIPILLILFFWIVEKILNKCEIYRFPNKKREIKKMARCSWGDILQIYAVMYLLCVNPGFRFHKNLTIV